MLNNHGTGYPENRSDAAYAVDHPASNLCCLCHSHHRPKTLARGWRFVMDPDGTLHVTTPSGVTRTTRPPGMHPPAPDPPDAIGSRPPSPSSNDEPPPF